MIFIFYLPDLFPFNKERAKIIKNKPDHLIKLSH